jgi:STE24 endopeptidase
MIALLAEFSGRPVVKVAAVIYLLLWGATFSGARAEAPSSPASPITQNASPISRAGYDTSPVAVPEPTAKATSFYGSSMALLDGVILWNLLFPALFLFTGFSARLRSWAQKLGRRWYLTFVLYSAAFVAIYFLASLPLYYCLSFVLLHHYDLSNQTFGRWLAEYARYAAVVTVLQLAVGWFPYRLVRKSPRRWWLYLGLVTLPFLCVLQLVGPVVIDPLFHKFQPLQDKALEARILATAGRAGIAGSRVYEVNMSADTKLMNAYVTGFLGSKRIVFWDTLLKSLDDDERQFILAHEMGHYVLGHVVQLMVVEWGLILVSLYVIYRLAGRLIARFEKRFGFNTPSDIAAIALGFLLVVVLALATTPVMMAFSRHVEHEADRFGLELTRNNHAAAMAFVKIQQNNLMISRPGIIFTLWLGSHPSRAERIEFCNGYRPWESGQPLKYAHYFRP